MVLLDNQHLSFRINLVFRKLFLITSTVCAEEDAYFSGDIVSALKKITVW